MKALVIDDSKFMRSRIGKILEELGHDYREAGTGEEALDILRREPDWGVLMVDWNMPGMNGLNFSMAVRSDSKYKSVPIIMITTETEIASVEAALKAGVNEYIMKPFKKEAIQEKLALLGL